MTVIIGIVIISYLSFTKQVKEYIIINEPEINSHNSQGYPYTLGPNQFFQVFPINQLRTSHSCRPKQYSKTTSHNKLMSRNARSPTQQSQICIISRNHIHNAITMFMIREIAHHHIPLLFHPHFLIESAETTPLLSYRLRIFFLAMANWILDAKVDMSHDQLSISSNMA